MGCRTPISYMHIECKTMPERVAEDIPKLLKLGIDISKFKGRLESCVDYSIEKYPAILEVNGIKFTSVLSIRIRVNRPEQFDRMATKKFYYVMYENQFYGMQKELIDKVTNKWFEDAKMEADRNRLRAIGIEPKW